MLGVSLLLRHPEVASLSCAACQQYSVGNDWKVTTRIGKPVPRPAGMPPPCCRCPKLSAEDRANHPTPDRAVELSARNWKAYLYYLEVKAGAPMASDPMTRRNCGLIRMVEDDVQRDRSDLTPLIQLLIDRG